MTRNRKILLVVVGALLIMCVGACILVAIGLPRLTERAFSQDPQRAHEVGTQIAQYTVPPGYHEGMSMDLLVSRVVALVPDDRDGMIIMLLSTNAPESQRQDMEQQMQQAFQQQVQRETGDLQYVGQQSVTVRGKAVTISISESKDGGAYRQAVGGFAGDNGYVMMMITGTVDEWDEQLLNNFFASIQ